MKKKAKAKDLVCANDFLIELGRLRTGRKAIPGKSNSSIRQGQFGKWLNLGIGNNEGIYVGERRYGSLGEAAFKSYHAIHGNRQDRPLKIKDVLVGLARLESFYY